MASVAALIDRGLARVQGSTIVRQGVVVFAASMILNLGGFIFHAVASRRIGVVNYGVLYALISTSTILAIPANLAAPVVARFAAEFRVLHDERHIRRLVLDVVRFFGAFAIVYLVVSVVLMKPAAAFLNAPIWPAPFVALIGGTLLMSGVLRAVAQGTQDYTGFARSCMADGVSKVIGVLAFTALGFTLFGTVAGFLSGALGGAVAIGIRLFRNYGTVEHCVIRYDWRRIAISGIGAAAITVAAALMGSADVILIKHYFDANLAGVYSAASLCGKILLYFVGFVPTVLLPQAAERHVRGESTRPALAMCVAILLVIGVFGLIAVRFFGILLLHALVGHAFDAAAPLLLPYSAAMMLLSLSVMLGSYGIATHRVAFAAPLLVGVFATLLAIVSFHDSLQQVVTVVAVGNGITVVAVAATLALQASAGKRRMATA